MKFTPSHRIVGAFLVMACLLVLVGYFAFITTDNLQKASRAIMIENVSSLKAAEELELAVLNQKGLVASYFLDGNPVWLRTLEGKKKDFHNWFEKAQEVALTDNEREILQDILALYTTYDNQRNRAIKSYQSGNPSEAKRILLGDMRNSIDNLYEKCEGLILANEALIAKAEMSSQKNVSVMRSLIWTTIFITLCLGAFLGFLIARGINEQLVRSSKLASLGQLAASIAHEVRNPLTAIKMRLYSLEEELEDDPVAKEDISVISKEINRMEKTVRNFLDFARPPELDLRKCDVNKILDDTINLVYMKADCQNVTIRKQHGAMPLEVIADEEQMRQVFLNIILNAMEAMENGGILEIAVNMSENKGSRNILKVAFRDTGPGMPRGFRNRVFEPFFTTKTEGTGLGLFIASRIIRMHKGKIDIQSRQGKGATVTVTLPAVQPQESQS